MNLPLLLAASPPASATTALTWPDWLMIALYFGILASVAWWVVRRSKDTAADYFLAGRNLGWWVIGASIFCSNIGSEHVVGLAGSGAKDGVAMAHYELHAWCLLVLAWVFVPFYARSLVFTMPEFLERRFSAGSRYMLSVISLITFVVSKIAVGIYAGGVVFSTLLPDVKLNLGGTEINSFWIGSVLVILLTGLYTALGGMRAVAYNDAVQTIILIAGSAVLTIYGLHTLGGWSELRRICGSDMFNLWKPLIPAGVEGSWSPILVTGEHGKILKEAWYFNENFPWLGMAICAPVIGLWYWCTDQYIVQRALGAPNQQVARRGSIFAAFLKLFPVYLFIIPGLICFALARSGKVPGLEHILGADGKPIHQEVQRAFPLMVACMLPHGLRGIVVAGLLSALMGSLAGVFNACSTLFTVDLYQKWKPNASQHQLVRTGRIATAIMVLVALAWIPIVQNASSLYEYLQKVQGYLAPPIFVVFFFGVFFKRLNAQGCLAAMVVGFLLGIFRLAVETPVIFGLKSFPPWVQSYYAQGSNLWIVSKINFQYFSILITLVSAVVMVLVSYLTKRPDYAKIGGLTYGTATAEDRGKTRASWDWRDVAASLLILACIAGAYIYFTG
jgi:SSS family solute:Na+ symporter